MININKRVELILDNAKKSSFNNEFNNPIKNKIYCRISDIVTLLNAGGKASFLNKRMISGKNYFHEVVYDDKTFIAASKKKIKRFKKFS